MSKRILQLAAVCAMLLTLAACADGIGRMDLLPVDDADPWIEMLPEASGVFELTEYERAHYEGFIRAGDVSVLYGLEPVSVIRLSIQAAIDGNFEHEFLLFHPDTLGQITLEDHLPPPDAPPEFAGTPEFRQHMANLFFSQIDQGYFTQDNERASISFYTETGEAMTLHARQDEGGVWLVEWWS